jgi:hypothetical protein
MHFLMYIKLTLFGLFPGLQLHSPKLKSNKALAITDIFIIKI